MSEKFKLLFKLNYQSIIIFIGILLIVSSVILSRPLNDLDEIWNYNFARNIANGLIPYKDFNMLQTPLLPLIAGLLLKLFGNELIVMRALAILLISALFFMVYKILKKLNVNIFYNLFCILLLFLLLKNYICIDYNFAILFLTLILIYLELNSIIKNNINSKKCNNYFNNNLLFYFFIGFICGCCILLKQSTGCIITIISILYPILFIKNKIYFKNYLKTTVIKILGILIPIIFLMIYLILNNAFFDFIDYTILGIKTFTNSIPYTNLIHSENIYIKLMSILIPIFILISGINLLIKKDKKLYGFYFYSIASLIVIYPIADNIHFLIGITPFFILFVYLLFNFFKYLLNNKFDGKLILKNKINNINLNKENQLEKNNKYYKLNKNKNLILKIKLFLYELLKSLITLSLIIYIIFSTLILRDYLNNSEKKHTIEHYKNIPISEELINKINEIDNYILSQNTSVYILDAESAIYMISIDRYNKDFDMFLKGNLGSMGEIGQIEKIKNLEIGTKILIRNKKYNLNWQTPMEVIFYIRNNLNKIGEISIFDIYEIN